MPEPAGMREPRLDARRSGREYPGSDSGLSRRARSRRPANPEEALRGDSRRSVSHLPRVSGRECIRALQRLGFEEKRREGSHVVLRRSEPFAHVVVPDHKELVRGTLRAILRLAGVEPERFRELRDSAGRGPELADFLIVGGGVGAGGTGRRGGRERRRLGRFVRRTDGRISTAKGPERGPSIEPSARDSKALNRLKIRRALSFRAPARYPWDTGRTRCDRRPVENGWDSCARARPFSVRSRCSFFRLPSTRSRARPPAQRGLPAKS